MLLSTKRTTKDQYYMNIAKEVAMRSTCFRGWHGAIIVKEDQIISTGYVGAPRKTKDCFERGNCLRNELNVPHGQQYELCRSVHAEQNAIINAARSGVSLLGAKIYLYSMILDKDMNSHIIDAAPCFICKKMIINAGISEVIAIQKDESLKTSKVEDWVKDWQEKDLIDDKDQYGKNAQNNK